MAQHTGKHRSGSVITAIVTVTLITISAIIYLSPVASQRGAAQSKVRVVTTTMPRSPWTGARSGSEGVPTPKHVTVTSVAVDKSTAPPSPRCSLFRWQQDAQAAYLADLADPYGLDGAPGPANGNGLACDSLPRDPSRPASLRADPFVWGPVSAPSKAAVLSPDGKYFGIASDGLPGDSTKFDQEDKLARKAPSMVEWFQYFGEGYPAAKVSAAWQRRAVPVITWMSAPSGFAGTTDLSAYSLASIAAGRQDAYITSWAAAVAAQRMPVVIRFDHEANGNWYPWSVGWNKQGISGNSPSSYVAAWRHVWQIFRAAGANDYAIWAYVPSRIDTLGDYGTNLTQTQIIASSYPGDQYVDWVGMDGYQYDASESSTAGKTFTNTLTALQTFTAKPVLIAEMGSSETGTAIKPEWIKSALAMLGNLPQVVGAVYFDNDVTGVHYINGVAVRTNWRVDSSSAALTAFRQAVASPVYAAGFYPPYLQGD